MRPLSPSDLLELLDRGHDLAPVGRALLLLARAWPGSSVEAREALPIGRRDALLIALRAHTFGARASFAASCAACGEQLEASLDLAQVLAEHPDEGDPGAEHTLEHDGVTVTFRLPSSADLLALEGRPEGGAEDFARRVVTSIDGRAPDAETPPSEAPLPAGVAQAIAADLEQADPLAVIRFEVVCGDCGESRRQTFDIVPYLWREIETAGERVVREVHALASVYGWTEREILRLSAARRAMYLRQVAS